MSETIDPKVYHRVVRVVVALFVTALILGATAFYLGFELFASLDHPNVVTETSTETSTETFVRSATYTNTYTTTVYTATTSSTMSVSRLPFPLFGNLSWQGLSTMDFASFPKLQQNLSIPINNHNFIITPINGTLTAFQASTYISQDNETLKTTISGRAVITGSFALRIDGNETTNIGNRLVHGIDYSVGTTTISFFSTFDAGENADSIPLYISVDFTGVSEFRSDSLSFVTLKTNSFHWDGRLTAKLYSEFYTSFTKFLENHD